MALPRIETLLSTDSEMQPVVAKAREINALANLCNEFLPPELAAQVRPANLQGDKLVILAANSAAAAKLKLLSGSLSDFLAKRGAKVNSVFVKVQPGEAAAASAPQPDSKRVSDRAFSVLSELYSTLGESPARQALKRLLEAETRGRRRNRTRP
jgi:hypothetical protein